MPLLVKVAGPERPSEGQSKLLSCTAITVEMYAERSKGGKFEIVGISLDEDVGLVPRFAASRGLKWPQTALGPEAKNPLAQMYNAHSTPMTVLVDAEGKIAAVNLLGEDLRKKIAEMLSAK